MDKINYGIGDLIRFKHEGEDMNGHPMGNKTAVARCVGFWTRDTEPPTRIVELQIVRPWGAIEAGLKNDRADDWEKHIK